MFEDRKDAGDKLALALERYKGENVVVLAIPKGGVEVGYQVARHLDAGFSVLISRKLPYPYDPEAGFGAIAEDGSVFMFQEILRYIPQATLDEIVKEQTKEIARRIALLRKSQPLPEVVGETVILVDDGMAMGSTMRAAIALCRNRKAGKIVVAVPVSGKEVAEEIARIADEVVVLEKPEGFRAVAQAYRNWYDVSDREVIEIMERVEEQESFGEVADSEV